MNVDGAQLLSDPGAVVALMAQALAQGLAVGAAMLAITLVYRRR